ncbi:MAG: hypothetical protein MUO26_15320 [Methanotrichaceae archaeon]|nr:hypothetical protein [Methanotrichaceae archaeon]
MIQIELYKTAKGEIGKNIESSLNRNSVDNTCYSKIGGSKLADEIRG